MGDDLESMIANYRLKHPIALFFGMNKVLALRDLENEYNKKLDELGITIIGPYQDWQSERIKSKIRAFKCITRIKDAGLDYKGLERFFDRLPRVKGHMWHIFDTLEILGEFLMKYHERFGEYVGRSEIKCYSEGTIYEGETPIILFDELLENFHKWDYLHMKPRSDLKRSKRIILSLHDPEKKMKIMESLAEIFYPSPVIMYPNGEYHHEFPRSPFVAEMHSLMLKQAITFLDDLETTPTHELLNDFFVDSYSNFTTSHYCKIEEVEREFQLHTILGQRNIEFQEESGRRNHITVYKYCTLKGKRIGYKLLEEKIRLHPNQIKYLKSKGFEDF